MQIYFLFLIIYYFILLRLKESTIERILKILPKKLKDITMKSIIILKKSGIIFVYCLVILLIASILLANHYFDLFFTNFDINIEKIYEIYKKKNKILTPPPLPIKLNKICSKPSEFKISNKYLIRNIKKNLYKI